MPGAAWAGAFFPGEYPGGPHLGLSAPVPEIGYAGQIVGSFQRVNTTPYNDRAPVRIGGLGR